MAILSDGCNPAWVKWVKLTKTRSSLLRLKKLLLLLKKWNKKVDLNSLKNGEKGVS